MILWLSQRGVAALKSEVKKTFEKNKKRVLTKAKKCDIMLKLSERGGEKSTLKIEQSRTN